MTNKLKYFIGNWKMFGDFSDFKIIHRINIFSSKSKKIINHINTERYTNTKTTK